MSLPSGDSRHGLNGYSNLGCRCDTCRRAGTEWHRGKYGPIHVGREHKVDAPRDLYLQVKDYAAGRQTSIRQVVLKAVAEYMERNP